MEADWRVYKREWTFLRVTIWSLRIAIMGIVIVLFLIPAHIKLMGPLLVICILIYLLLRRSRSQFSKKVAPIKKTLFYLDESLRIMGEDLRQLKGTMEHDDQNLMASQLSVIASRYQKALPYDIESINFLTDWHTKLIQLPKVETSTAYEMEVGLNQLRSPNRELQNAIRQIDHL